MRLPVLKTKHPRTSAQASQGLRARPALFIAGSLGAMMLAIAIVAVMFANSRDSDQVKIEQKIVRSANKDGARKTWRCAEEQHVLGHSLRPDHGLAEHGLGGTEFGSLCA
jgi:hypothetical protein